MKTDKPKIIVILGPTASGKSSLGEQLCLKYEGEIISADSRQVYRKLDLGTGKEKLKVKQHLIDIADQEQRVTVVDWKQKADRIIDELIAKKIIPVIVGGSSLYVQSLINNYQFAPEDKHGELRQKLEQQSVAELNKQLKKINPKEQQNIDPNNRRYLVRMLERNILNTVKEEALVEPKYDCLLLGIDMPRKELYKKIDQRVDVRLTAGMLTEVEDLLASGVDAKWLISLGLEYRYLTKYLQGELSKEEAISKLKFATHHFARRQLIWWRRRNDIHWVNNSTQALALAAEFLKV